MSALSDAIMASFAADLNPDAKATREFIQVTVDEKRKHLVTLDSEIIEGVEQKLLKAIERNADASVIDAYRKCLAKAVA